MHSTTARSSSTISCRISTLHCSTALRLPESLGVKAILRKLKARTYKDLIDGITDAMLKVTKEDIRNWFATRS